MFDLFLVPIDGSHGDLDPGHPPLGPVRAAFSARRQRPPRVPD